MTVDFNLIGMLSGAAGRWRAYRRSSRARRMIADLSPEMRKDIGWPDISAGGDRPRGWQL